MAEPRRILLVEVTPRVPQPAVPSTWSPTDKHTDIALSAGNLTSTKSTLHAGNWAWGRANTPMSAGQWYWEVTVNYSGSADVVVGVAEAAFPLNQVPQSFINIVSCVVAKAGTVYGLGGGNVGPIASGTVVRCWLDMDSRTLRIAVGAGTWNTFTFTTAAATTTLFPIVGFLHPSGTVVSATANFGASAFALGVPDGVNSGVYSTPPPAATTFYFGSEGFNTSPGDTPASTHYEGRLDGQQDAEISREGGCWVWGNQSASRRGQVVLINTDGGLDAWAGMDWRDAPITLLSGVEGQSRDKFTVWSAGVVDTIEFTADLRVRLSLADPLALLDRAIQPNVYPDTAQNPQIIGKPIPIVIGRPLYCTPVRLNALPSARDYQVHDNWTGAGQDRYLTSIDAVFDMGDRFAGPDDPYTPHSPLTLANGGNFTTWVNDPALGAGLNMPQSFGRVTGFTATDRFQQGATAGTLRCISSGQAWTAIYHTPSSLLAGYRYVISFDATVVGKAGTIIFRADGPTPNLPFDDAAITITTTGAKSVTIDVTEQAQPQIVLGRSEADITVDNLKIDSVQIIDWTYWSGVSAKMGFTLTNAPIGKVVCNPVGQLNSNVGQVVERLNLVLAQVCTRTGQATVGTSALTLMGKANYRIASYIDSAKTALQFAREVMDSWCGWIVPRRGGQLEVGRVEEPSNIPVLTLDRTNVMDEIVITTDAAKGLTTLIGGRRNHSPHADSDIATSVPPALAAELKSELTCIRAGAPALTTAPVSAAYVAAIGAPPKATLLQDAADIQAEANRVASLWRPRRMFYAVTAVLGASAADSLEPGQTVRVVWPRYGLDAGKNLLVIGVTSRFFDRRVQLKLWG